MTIVRRGSGFRVISKNGKNLGDEPSKEAAIKRLKQVEFFKHHNKCIIDSSLVKTLGSSVGDSDGNIAIYQPVFFSIVKLKDKEAQKLDFPSTTKQLELKDVKQPEFPSTPYSGESYSQSFHNPRPSNDVKDGTHVTISGGFRTEYGPGPFRGEHGPDVQYKGSDYVSADMKAKARAKKSIMIAGRRVVIRKGSEGSDNENLRNYPIDRSKGESIDPRNEAEKRKDWLRSERIKEDVKAYEDAKKIHSYAPGNGPFELAMDTKTSYLGRAKDSKRIGEYTKEYPGAKVTFNQPIDSTKKPKKVFVHLTEHGRDVKATRTDKSKGIMNLVLQYTQNQPLAAGFKPIMAYLVKDDEDSNVDERIKKKKAMTTEDIAEKVSKFPSKGPSSKSRIRLMERASRQKAENSADVDDNVGPHPDFGPSGGYKGDTSKLGKGGFKDQWIKQQEAKGKDPLKVPGKIKKEKPNKLAGTKKSSRPNPIKGGIGDKLDYKDVDEKELAAGIDVEQEHVKNSDDDEDKKNVKAADIAMDHLEEDDKYYTHLAEMEREAKEEDKNETKKKKLLRVVDKSLVFRKGKGDPPTSEKKIRHAKALEGRAERAKQEWKDYEELEKLSEIKEKELDRKRY